MAVRRPSSTCRFSSSGRNVLDVALAAVQLLDAVGLDVHEHDRAPGVGEHLGQRDADVASADDRNLGLQGYSSCGPKDYRHADGTSFASPQVAAAAALLFALAPNQRPDQVSAILERSADDATPQDGCDACTSGRDPLTGNRTPRCRGRDPTADAAVSSGRPLRAERRHGPRGWVVYGGSLIARPTLDTWDDPNDVYSIKLRRGQGLSVVVRSGKLDTSIFLWKPGLQALALGTDELRARRSVHPEGVPERLVYRARASGWYYLQVKLARQGSGPYSIHIAS